MQTIIDQLLATSWIEWLGTITGVVGVYLSIKEKVVAWLLFIVCYSAYVYLSWQAELYAALKMHVVFIVISIYGWALGDPVEEIDLQDWLNRLHLDD